MSKVTKIEAQPKQEIKLRVAAYCRVSTDSSEQLESLNAQKSHYSVWISSHKNWSFAGLYYDAGITGTKTECRDGLQSLIHDCRMGKIDMIVTKSISRFSRNTTDCIALVRELLGMEVHIYFEKENLNTGNMESELMLSILSSLAESESVSISENEKWSVKRRFQNGTYKSAYLPYGYTKDENGDMMIHREEAKIVEQIFTQFLSGVSMAVIAQRLKEQHIPTRKGGKWCAATVRNILENERYVGDAMFQKTYTDSSFKRHHNHGEVDCYLVQEHHEAIVSREDFDKVQTLIAQRAEEKGIIKGAYKYCKRYAFSGNLICGNCGATLKRRTHYNTSGSYIAWCCKTHLENKAECSAKFVRDDVIKAAFLTMMNKLIFARKLLLKPLLESLKAERNHHEADKLEELRTQIEKTNHMQSTLTQLLSQNMIDRVFYIRESGILKKEAEGCRAEIALLQQSETSHSRVIQETTDLLHFTEKAEPMKEFDNAVFLQFVERVLIVSRTEAEFHLKCGLKLREVL